MMGEEVVGEGREGEAYAFRILSQNDRTREAPRHFLCAVERCYWIEGIADKEEWVGCGCCEGAYLCH